MGKLTSVWNAYLPIGGTLKTKEPPDADLVWLSSRGIEAEALSVLRRVRRDVLPLVRQLEAKKYLQSFSFFVHDRTSGVPCEPEDSSAYVHLRLVIQGRSNIRELLPKEWVYLRRFVPTLEEELAHDIIDLQSALYLKLIEQNSELGDVDLLRKIRQFLHYFANMTQMRVQ